MTAVASDLDVLVAHYSRTGTTRQLAEAVASALGARTEAIRPRRSRRYPDWLLRSFVPGSMVAVEPPHEAPGDFDAVVLCSPKWTLSCPPVNGYLDRVALDDTPIVVVITHAGFAVPAFVRRLVARVGRAGGEVVGTDAVHRDDAATAGPDDEPVASVVADLADVARGDRDG